jgi:hypothetical protein
LVRDFRTEDLQEATDEQLEEHAIEGWLAVQTTAEVRGRIRRERI